MKFSLQLGIVFMQLAALVNAETPQLVEQRHSIQKREPQRLNLTTAPNPPTNLSITMDNWDMAATVNWDPPPIGQHTAFRLKLNSLSETGKTVWNIVIKDTSSILRDLTPGASYEVQLYSIFENKESQTYISTNFTTKPNPPGRGIIWFRNETTLLLFWQPPFPAGFYTDYKVSIDPEDAKQSCMYVKSDNPDSPSQATFNGLVPGKAYNISVQTISEDRVSEPRTNQYRTVPLRPHNVTFNPNKIGPYSFEVEWEGPDGESEFDRYTVAIGIRRKTPQTIDRGQPLVAHFTENLHPGQTYKVVVKSHIKDIASWPASGNVTTRPLPVTNIQKSTDNNTGEITLTWKPSPDSLQDTYKVEYQEMETLNGDSGSVIVDMPAYTMSNLQSGRNYSFTIKAISNGLESLGMTVSQDTRPSLPFIRDFRPTTKSSVAVDSEQLLLEILSSVKPEDVDHLLAMPPRPVPDDFRFDSVQKEQPTSLLPQFNFNYDYTIVQEELPAHFLPIDYKIVQEELPANFLPIDYKIVQEELPAHLLPIDFEIEPEEMLANMPPNNFKLIKEEMPVSLLLKIYGSLEDIPVSLLPMEHRNYIIHKNLPTTLPPEDFKIDPVQGEQSASLLPKFVASEESMAQNPVTEILFVLDAKNITLKWPRPEGRIEFYYVTWYPLTYPEELRHKEIQADTDTPGVMEAVLVDNLRPGVEYQFSLRTQSNNLLSKAKQINIRTQPLCTSQLVIINKQEISDPNIPDILTYTEKAASDPKRKVTFVDLVPGRLYNITMWTVSADVESKPQHRQERLHPQPISYINATDITLNEISLIWDPPHGDFDAFEILYQDDEDRLIQKYTTTNSITVGGLTPHWNYTFVVITISGDELNLRRQSTTFGANFTTEAK